MEKKKQAAYGPAIFGFSEMAMCFWRWARGTKRFGHDKESQQCHVEAACAGAYNTMKSGLSTVALARARPCTAGRTS